MFLVITASPGDELNYLGFWGRGRFFKEQIGLDGDPVNSWFFFLFLSQNPPPPPHSPVRKKASNMRLSGSSDSSEWTLFFFSSLLAYPSLPIKISHRLPQPTHIPRHQPPQYVRLASLPCFFLSAPSFFEWCSFIYSSDKFLPLLIPFEAIHFSVFSPSSPRAQPMIKVAS